MIWLVVLTILKNISRWEGLSHILWNIKNVWNHQPVIVWWFQPQPEYVCQLGSSSSPGKIGKWGLFEIFGKLLYDVAFRRCALLRRYVVLEHTSTSEENNAQNPGFSVHYGWICSLSHIPMAVHSLACTPVPMPISVLASTQSVRPHALMPCPSPRPFQSMLAAPSFGPSLHVPYFPFCFLPSFPYFSIAVRFSVTLPSTSVFPLLSDSLSFLPSFPIFPFRSTTCMSECMPDCSLQPFTKALKRTICSLKGSFHVFDAFHVLLAMKK